mgnify:FL=1
MREVIRILIVDYKSATEKKRHTRDLFAFCKVARIQQPILLPLKGEDCYEIDITDRSERTALLWLHILCDLAALNEHFVVEFQQRDLYTFCS